MDSRQIKRPRLREGDDIIEDMSDLAKETSARIYPRKRVAIACDVCRVRKTRCDAAKPSCSFCTETGIECRYSGPSQDDRRLSAPDTEYTRTLKRLEGIQATLDAVAAAVGVGSADIANESTSNTHGGGPPSTSPASQTLSLKKVSIPRMPNLFKFKAQVVPRSADSWSYDCTKDFFRHQMMVEEDLCDASRASGRDLNLSRPHLWRLQRSFIENVLSSFPLFDHVLASRYLQEVKLDEQEDSPLACVVLLMYANGALAADTSLYAASSASLAGFQYFARAMKTLKQLPRSGENLCLLQCHVLASMYLLLALRPVEAWKMIRQASQTCIFLLKAKLVDQNVEYQEAFSRIYWICYILESELEVGLELPASGLRVYEEAVSLPTSNYDEEGMFNLLALASLRRLMVEVVDTVGLTSPAANYAPVVTLELRSQIDHWYQHLPQGLKFPSDESLLFDLRQAYLKCMYYALIAVAFWPFVPRCRDLVHDGSNEAASETTLRDEDRARMQQGTEQCLDASRKYLRAAEEILTQKSLVSHMVIRSYYTTAMILLLVQPIRTTSSLTNTSADVNLILHAAQNLNYWHTVPFLQRPLEEMSRMINLKQLSIRSGW